MADPIVLPDSVLPPVLAADLRSKVIERLLAQQLARIDPATMVPRLFATAPAAALPFLAAEFGIADHPVWRAAMDAATQRDVLAQAIPLVKRAGTAWAVRQALAVLQITAQVQEWFSQAPQGTPGTFAVDGDVFDVPVTLALRTAALAAVDASKNLRSWLTGLTLATATRGRIATCASTVVATQISVFPK